MTRMALQAEKSSASSAVLYMAVELSKDTWKLLVAERHGVALVAYEGGNELGFARGTDAYQVRLNGLTAQANRDPRMGEVYGTFLADWKAAGGELFMVFESTGSYSMYGNSTLLDWQGQPPEQAPKYAAVSDFVAANPCWWDGCAALPADHLLSVSIVGTGSGTVSSDPPGIACGSDCNERYAPGTALTLHAVPARRATFTGWSGGGCSGNGSCTVVMDADQMVTATFAGARPDFRVTDITLTPAAPQAHATFTASIMVANQGSASGNGKRLTVWPDRAAEQPCAAPGGRSTLVGTLAPGASKTLTISGLAAGGKGTKLLRAFVDSACVTAEVAEDDNQLTRAYDVVR